MRHLPDIDHRVIPHTDQYYDTAGNYWDDGSEWKMRVSKMEDWRYEALVTLHEFIEMCLTTHHNISWDDIDYFDRNEGKDSDDPGRMPEAPYHNEHMLAMQLEKKFAKMLGVDWKKYDSSFADLKWRDKL